MGLQAKYQVTLPYSKTDKVRSLLEVWEDELGPLAEKLTTFFDKAEASLEQYALE